MSNEPDPQQTLQQLNEQLSPDRPLAIASQEPLLDTEIENGTSNVQDNAQATLTSAGVDGETAASAAAVVAEEALHPDATRSIEEQHTLEEAVIQLQQEEQLATSESSLTTTAQAYLDHTTAAETEMERAGYPTQAVVSHENVAYGLYQAALEQGVSEEEFQQTVNVLAQPQRVAIVAPIVAEMLNHNETHQLAGSQNQAAYDPQTQLLTVCDRETETPFLSARWDGTQWQDCGSGISAVQVDYFRSEVYPQLQQAIEGRQERHQNVESFLE